MLIKQEILQTLISERRTLCENLVRTQEHHILHQIFLVDELIRQTLTTVPVKEEVNSAISTEEPSENSSFYSSETEPRESYVNRKGVDRLQVKNKQLIEKIARETKHLDLYTPYMHTRKKQYYREVKKSVIKNSK